MVYLRFKRSVLGFASCALGLILFLPTSSWATSFALDAGIFGGKFTGDIYFTGTSTNLAFDPTQNVTYNDYGTSFLLTPLTASPFTSITFTTDGLHDIPLTNCGSAATTCQVGFDFTTVLSPLNSTTYSMEITRAGISRAWGPTGASQEPAAPLLPSFGDEVQFLTSQLRPIPEPGTIMLLTTGLLGLAGYRWHQRRREGTQVG